MGVFLLVEDEASCHVLNHLERRRKFCRNIEYVYVYHLCGGIRVYMYSSEQAKMSFLE